MYFLSRHQTYSSTLDEDRFLMGRFRQSPTHRHLRVQLTYNLALFTLRPSLVEKVLAHLSQHDVCIRLLNEKNRDTEPEAIIGKVFT